MTRIQALSWRHATPNNPLLPIAGIGGQGEIGRGIVIGFTKDVVTEPIDADHIFQVLVRSGTAAQQRTGLICRCPVTGRIVPVKYNHDGAGRVVSAEEVPPPVAPGVAFIFPPEVLTGRNILNGEIDDLWVVLRCDFVLDTTNRAVDGEHVRAQLPTGDRPAGSPAGVQGGLFESWFLTRQG